MNLQVHCTYCDKSLYTIEPGLHTEPPSVRLYDDSRGSSSFNPAFDTSRHEFCNWLCVERWARSKHEAAA